MRVKISLLAAAFLVLVIAIVGGLSTFKYENETTGMPYSDFEVPGGYVNTGLAYDFVLDCLWSGSAFEEKVYKLSKAGTSLDSFAVTGDGGVQGVAYDTSDNTLWVVNGKDIYNYSKSGSMLGTISTYSGSSQNLSAALGYIPADDYLIVGVNNSNTLHFVDCSDGSEVGTLTVSAMTDSGGIDGCAYDPNSNTMWLTQNGDPAIYHVDMSGDVIGIYANPEPGDQAEGICIDTTDNILWFSADGEYHASVPDGNRIFPFPVENVYGVEGNGM